MCKVLRLATNIIGISKSYFAPQTPTDVRRQCSEYVPHICPAYPLFNNVPFKSTYLYVYVLITLHSRVRTSKSLAKVRFATLDARKTHNEANASHYPFDQSHRSHLTDRRIHTLNKYESPPTRSIISLLLQHPSASKTFSLFPFSGPFIKARTSLENLLLYRFGRKITSRYLCSDS